MATKAHCAYCFETLSASLEKRTPLSLPQVERYWKQYNSDDPIDDPTLELDDEDDEEIPDAADENTAPRPAAISRLLAPSPLSSSSSSSSVSTPVSGISEASSATSKSSSRSSFFSPPRQNGKSAVETKAEYSKVAASEVDESPLFVTWNTVSARSGERRLRGCIGTFEKQVLAEGLRSYALTSAFDDTRFPPITARELPTLECGVTLLTHFEPISDPLDWEIGTHGLRISFTHHGRRYGSTYLPDVAREQGWSKEETMVSLMRKAGWQGRGSEWKGVGGLSVVRYQGRKVELGYREWKEWRDWVEDVEG